jgi:hypothetical protein
MISGRFMPQLFVKSNIKGSLFGELNLGCGRNEHIINPPLCIPHLCSLSLSGVCVCVCPLSLLLMLVERSYAVCAGRLGV